MSGGTLCVVVYEYPYEMYLVVLSQLPNASELRAFWKANENNVLDEVLDADRLWIGRSCVLTPEGSESPGPAGRVFDLLGLLGTTPTYTAPQITQALIGKIMDAFSSPTDPAFPSTTPAAVEAFLVPRAGKYLLSDEDSSDYV